MLLLNELGQWAVLIFLGIFIVGLTRQLGNFLVPQQERLAATIGPEIGGRLPDALFSSEQRQLLSSLMASADLGWSLVMVVDEDCVGCESVLEGLESAGLGVDAPIAALSRKSGSTHTKRLHDLAEVVVVDEERIKAAGLVVTPFLMVIDDQFKVLHKEVAPDARHVVTTWNELDGNRDPTASSRDLELVQAQGGTS